MASRIYATDSSSPEVDDSATSSMSDSKEKKSVRFKGADANKLENSGDVSVDRSGKHMRSVGPDEVRKEATHRDSTMKFPQRSSAISVRMDDLELDDETEDDLSDSQEKVGKEFEKDLRSTENENKTKKQIQYINSTDADTTPALSSSSPLPHASKLVDRQSADAGKAKSSNRPLSHPTTEPEQTRNTKPDSTDKVCAADKRRLSEIRPADEIRCTCEDYERYPEHIRSESQEKTKNAHEKGTKTSNVPEPEAQSSKKHESKRGESPNEVKDQQEYKLTKKDSSTLGKLWDNLKSATNNLGKKPPSDPQPAPTQKPASFRDTQSLSSVPVSGIPDFVQRFSSASKLADIVKPDVTHKGPVVPIQHHSPHIKVHAKIDMGTGKIEKIVLENTEHEELPVKKEAKQEEVPVKQEPRFEFLPVEQLSASQIPKVPSGTVQPEKQLEDTSAQKPAESQQLMDEPVDETEWSPENSPDESTERSGEQENTATPRLLPNGASTVSEFLMERPITDVMFSRPTAGRKKSQGRANDKRLQAKAAPIPFHKLHETPSDTESKRKRKRVRFADSDELSESEMSDNLEAAGSNQREEDTPASAGEKIADRTKELYESAKSAVTSAFPPIKSGEVSDVVKNTGDKLADGAKELYESAKSAAASVVQPNKIEEVSDAVKNTGDKLVDGAKGLYESAKSAVASVVPPNKTEEVSDAVKNTGDTLADEAKGLYESAKSAAASAVPPNKIEKVSDAVKNTGNKLVDGAKGLYESARSAVGSITVPVSHVNDTANSNIGENITDSTKQLYEQGKDTVATAISPDERETHISDAVSGSMESTAAKAESLYESAKDAIMSAASPDATRKDSENIKPVQTDNRKAVAESTPDSDNTSGFEIVNKLETVKDVIQEKSENLSNAVKEKSQNIPSPSEIAGKLESVKDAVADKGTSLITTAKNVVQEKGENLISTVKEKTPDIPSPSEITNKLESVQDAVVEKGTSLFSTAKDVVQEKGENLISAVKDKAPNIPSPSEITNKLESVQDAVVEKGTSLFNTAKAVVQDSVPSTGRTEEKATVEGKGNVPPQANEPTATEKAKQMFGNVKTQLINQTKKLTESARDAVTSFVDGEKSSEYKREPKVDKSDASSIADNTTADRLADTEVNVELEPSFTENISTKGVGQVIKESVAHAFKSDESKAASISRDKSELEKEPDAKERDSVSTPLPKVTDAEEEVKDSEQTDNVKSTGEDTKSAGEDTKSAEEDKGRLGEVKDQVQAQDVGVFDSAKEKIASAAGIAEDQTSKPEVDNQDRENQAEATDVDELSEGEAPTAGVQPDLGKQQPTPPAVPQKGSFIDLVKSEGLGSAIRSVVTNAFSQSSLPVNDSSEVPNNNNKEDENQPDTTIDEPPRPSKAALSDSEILTEESEDDAASSKGTTPVTNQSGKELLPQKDSADLDPPPSPIHATRSLTDLKDDHSCRAVPMPKNDEEDSKMSLSNLQQNHPTAQESQGFFASIKNIIIHALEYHPPPRRHSGENIARPGEASSAEECAEYCIRHSGEYVIADLTHDEDHLHAGHRMSQARERTGETDRAEYHNASEAQSDQGVLSNMYGTVKEMLSYIFVTEHEESLPADEPPDTSITDSDMNPSTSNNPPVQMSSRDTDEASESEGAVAEIKAQGIKLRRILVDHTECAACHNEAVWRTKAQFERILTRKHNTDNEGRQAASEQTSSTRDTQRTPLDEGILRTRRARRRMPTTGIETDTFSMPYSFNQRGPPLNLDPNDDSESDSHTLPDHMFRPPAAVRYSAYIIGACMISMVFLALQYRLTDTVWFRPEIWIPRLAFVVLLTLVCGLVYGYLTKPDFVRKPSSGTRIDNNQAKTEVE